MMDHGPAVRKPKMVITVLCLWVILVFGLDILKAWGIL